MATAPKPSGSDTWSEDRAEASDAVLVIAAQAGQSDAFTHLYRRYVALVHSFALRRLSGRETAEDATQTTFLRALANLHSCREADHFAGWLFAIARNVVYDLQRAHQQHCGLVDLADDLPDPSMSPEHLAILRDADANMRQIWSACLTPREQDALELRLLGLNDKDISIVLRGTHGGIRTMQYRSLRKLHDYLVTHHPEIVQEMVTT